MGCDVVSSCDNVAVGSVTVSVVDSAGNPVAPESVVYSVDGSEDADCESLGGDGSEFVCGWEEDGEFDISVSTATADYSAQTTVALSLDGCHVQGEFVTVVVD